MHKWIAYIALAFGGLSILALGLFLYGAILRADKGALGFLLWAIIAAIAALIFGGLSRFISHRKSIRHALPAKLGILTAAAALVFSVGALVFLAGIVTFNS